MLYCQKEKESKAVRIINFGSLNIDTGISGGAVYPAGTDHHCEGLHRSWRAAGGIRHLLFRAQERINHRKRGKLNLERKVVSVCTLPYNRTEAAVFPRLCEGTCPSVFRMAEDSLTEVHHQPETAEEQAGAQGRLQAAVRWPSFMSAEQRKRKGRPSGLPFTSTARI